MTPESIRERIIAVIHELDVLLETVRIDGTRAFRGDDFASAKVAIDRAQRLQELRQKQVDWLDEWELLYPSHGVVSTSVAPAIAVVAKRSPDRSPILGSSSETGAVPVTMEYGPAIAHGRYWLGNHLVVLAGSAICADDHDSLRPHGRELRQRLREEGSLVMDDRDPSVLRLTKDIRFVKPSAAGIFVAGCSVNGRVTWKIDATGQTIKEYASNV